MSEGADEVDLGLSLDGVSLLLGDFQVPTDCLGPTLVGFFAMSPPFTVPEKIRK